jgi:glycosyltransferase involved in cell wall biosynthesis
MGQLCISVYTCAFPPYLQCGGGCALRYFTLVKNLLNEHCKVILFTVHDPQQVIEYDNVLKLFWEKKKLVIEKIPSRKNCLYPQIPLCDPQISFFKHAYQVFKENRVQLLIIPDTCETLPILFLAKLAGVRHSIYGIHTDLFKLVKSRKGWIKYLFMIPLFFHHIIASRYSDHCSVSSNAFKEQIKNQFAWKWVRIDNTFESSLWSSHFKLPLISDQDEICKWRYELSKGDIDAPLMIYAGRWSYEKRIRLLFEAIPAGWKLALIGDGPDLDCKAIEEIAKKYSNVYVKRGFLSPKELSRVYHCADFFVSASDFETFGFSVIESLACGTPVVVEKAGGFLDNVKHGINGYLVKFEDAEETKKVLVAIHPKSQAYKILKKNVILENEDWKIVDSKSFIERFSSRHSFKTNELGSFRFSSILIRYINWIYFTLSFLSLKICTWIFS